MKRIKVEEAVGQVLAHDIARIVPELVKDTPFKKGHIIREGDISKLLALGKENIYIWEKQEGMLHENEAAAAIKLATLNNSFDYSLVNEGKINISASLDGLLKINKELLFEINSVDEVVFATIHNNTPVRKGDLIAGTRVIPLVIEESKINKVNEILKGKELMSIIPYKSFKIGIVTTGSEIYKGMIEDGFGPVLIKKLKEYGDFDIEQTIIYDDKEKIKECIENFISKGCNLILCTGGMSVDPDDVTPSAIVSLGGEIISYGAPVLPGTMLLVSYFDNIPIIGLPGCVMYSKRTSFDLILPRLLVGEKIAKRDLIEFGHGGQCRSCEVCIFPNCGFGK